MEERQTATLLEVEKKQPQAPQIRQQPASTQSLKVNLTRLKQQASRPASDKKIVADGQINFFGGTAKKEEPQVVQDSASVIEKPNYDFIEPLSETQQKKIFKIKKERAKVTPSPLLKKLTIIVFALLVGVLGAWTIDNAVELSNVVTEYNLKLDQYLLKLGTLDSASNANDLFPTYPEEGAGATNFEKQSNWFDRFCNFVARLFGG